MSSVEIRFKVLELLQADAYGETYRILIGRKRISQQLGEAEPPRSNSGKSNNNCDNNEYSEKNEQKRRSLYDYSEETFTLKVMLQNKFNKTERTHILKKATQLISFTDCPNVGKIVKLFRSANNFFIIYKDPVWIKVPLPEHQSSEDFDKEQELKMKLNSKISVPLDESIDNESDVRINQPPLNLIEFLIERNKPLNLYEIRTIIYDLLLTLQQLHVKGIPHLDVQPLNMFVIRDFGSEDAIRVHFNSNAQQKVGADSNKKDEKNIGNNRYICLTNFGQSAGFFKKKFSVNKISSLYFMAPERVYGELQTDKEQLMCKVDLWSVGVLIHVLVFGKVPFEGDTYSQLVKTIKKGKLMELKKMQGGLGSLINLMQQLLQVEVNERFDAVSALHHDFFKISNIELSNMELKRKQLNNLQVLWCQLMLKDSIKNYACFFSSYFHLKETFEQVFKAKLPQNNKQIMNGFSWVTEDFTLANFIFNRAFSKAFKQSDQNDPNLPEQFKITSHNLTESFVILY